MLLTRKIINEKILMFCYRQLPVTLDACKVYLKLIGFSQTEVITRNYLEFAEKLID
jgi:hypothetical protein